MRYQALFAVFILASLLMPPATAGEEPNRNVINPGLREILERTGNDEKVDIIVQFRDDIKQCDLDTLGVLGFEIRHTYKAIPAANVVGSKESVIKLSNYQRTSWMEYNAELEYLMHDTTKVIKSTDAWNSLLEDRYGNIIKAPGGGNLYIDGQGVTAVVLDTGIDAGHPDFDYGYKVINNYKRTEAGWQEQKNSDTSSGHGTHCAGTVAGNGDASAGARGGVAPGANLIGLGCGDGLIIAYALEGLDWVFEHSRPNANPHNIRVVSNSWGSGGSENVYDPNNAITKVTERLTYENNVAVIFAAGNSGGNGNSVQTNPYANTPASVSVAALSRDGNSVAGFSSRGNKEKEHSWPDIGAPGDPIWSVAARETVIDMSQRPSDHELYYLAISGTSMATPHVAGAAALLWQAAPHLRTSEIHDDYSGDDPDGWYSNNNTKVHEIEIIFELTSRFLPGVSAEPVEGLYGRQHDFAQGYGLINMKDAVGLALTLEEMRTFDGDGDGKADTPEVTVFDALYEYLDLQVDRYVEKDTNTVYTGWYGEWAYFQENIFSNVYSTNCTKAVYIPATSEEITLYLDYAPFNLDRYSSVNLFLSRSLDGQNFDAMQMDEMNEGMKKYVLTKGDEFSDSETDMLWYFRVEGQGAGYKGDDEFPEPMAEFTVDFSDVLDMSAGYVEISFNNTRSYISQLEFGEPSGDYIDGTVSMNRMIFLASTGLGGDDPSADDDDDDMFGDMNDSRTVGLGLGAVIILLAGAFVVGRRSRGKREKTVAPEFYRDGAESAAPDGVVDAEKYVHTTGEAQYLDAEVPVEDESHIEDVDPKDDAVPMEETGLAAALPADDVSGEP